MSLTGSCSNDKFRRSVDSRSSLQQQINKIEHMMHDSLQEEQLLVVSSGQPFVLITNSSSSTYVKLVY